MRLNEKKNQQAKKTCIIVQMKDFKDTVFSFFTIKFFNIITF